MDLQLPGISYTQGGRKMFVSAIEPVALVKTVTAPDPWNPLGTQPHGNRPQDAGHRKGIAEYLENEEQFVLGAVVLYASPKDARFKPGPDQEDGVIQVGTLHLNYGAHFDVGDGQHRIGAYSDVINQHREPDDPVLDRLRRSGQPVVIVIDDDPIHRAQDFTDLQRNVKPPTGSLGMSMDRRQPVNRFCIKLVQSNAPIFGGGSRVEFLADSPGKLSAKLFSFKTVRYMIGTALIGVSERTASGWERAVNKVVETDPAAFDDMRDLWRGIGELPGFINVVEGTITPSQLREKYLLTSATILYAIAYAVHMAHVNHKFSFRDAATALKKVDFSRPEKKPDHRLMDKDSIFVGNLINRDTGKMESGRPSWEEAAQRILKVMIAK